MDLKLTEKQKEEFLFRTRKLRANYNYDIDVHLSIAEKGWERINRGMKFEGQNELSAFLESSTFIREIVLLAAESPVYSALLEHEYKITRMKLNACIKVASNFENVKMKGSDQATLFVPVKPVRFGEEEFDKLFKKFATAPAPGKTLN